MLALQLRAELATTNPLAYYHLIEHFMRSTCQYYSSSKGTSSNTSGTRYRSSSHSGYTAMFMLLSVNKARYMLQLPNLLSSETQQEKLLPTWQHYKAYTSAIASCMKAWVLLLQERWAAGDDACRDTSLPAEFLQAVQRRGTSGRVASIPEGREQWVVRLLEELDERIHDVLLSSIYDVDWKPAGVAGGRRELVGGFLAEAEAAGQKPTSSAIQLVLLMLVSRGVVAAGQLLLGADGGGGQGTGSKKGVRGKSTTVAAALVGKVATTVASRKTRPSPAAARKGTAASAAAAPAPVVLGVVSPWQRLVSGRRCSRRRLP